MTATNAPHFKCIHLLNKEDKNKLKTNNTEDFITDTPFYIMFQDNFQTIKNSSTHL